MLLSPTHVNDFSCSMAHTALTFCLLQTIVTFLFCDKEIHGKSENHANHANKYSNLFFFFAHFKNYLNQNRILTVKLKILTL